MFSTTTSLTCFVNLSKLKGKVIYEITTPTDNIQATQPHSILFVKMAIIILPLIRKSLVLNIQTLYNQIIMWLQTQNKTANFHFIFKYIKYL